MGNEGDEKYGKLVHILKQIREIVDSPNTEVLWSSYDTTEDLLRDIDDYIEKVLICDRAIIKNLRLLFAPTGDLQDISISSGWGEKYIEIADQFDEVVKALV